MIGMHNQMWVTHVVCDDDVEKALTLCYSLRRTFTTRRIAVIVSSKISTNLRRSLDYGFDLVFTLDESQNTANLKLEDFAKLYSFLSLRSFWNCVYLSPSMLALKNCDEMFGNGTDGLVMLEEAKDVSVFLFKPSVHAFHGLMDGLQKSQSKGLCIWEHLKAFANDVTRESGSLDRKFCKIIGNGKPLLGLENEISMIRFVDYPTESTFGNLEANGILEKLVATCWLKIHRECVLPLTTHLAHIPTDNYQLREQLLPAYEKEPIAIVGMSCRLPGSNNLEEFWDLLFQGQDGTCCPPPFRWTREQSSKYHPDSGNINAGFLKGLVDEFDAKFFGISPKEALYIDPQHRLLLELTWEALEDACINPHSLRGTFGSVFMGSWLHDYNDILMQSRNSDYYREYIGNSIGAAAARISFLLGIMGPSIATESMCSSAMVAVHLACKSLRLGETNLALACGVNILLNPVKGDELPGIVSPDGHCKTFSEDANGFARGEGGAVLVLKRLSDALKDGDNIWGLIRGSSVCQEGISHSMGTPTVQCESAVITRALRDAMVSPKQVSYVEAHGTGTQVGDTLEAAAITKAYYTPYRKEPLIIGSVKTNVGHTESCSGITGIIKVILSMHNEIIPQHRNFTKLNPAIDLNAIPAVLPLENMNWKRNDTKPRIVGVSSFGFSGTDAHVIIEESPETPSSKCLESNLARPLHILKISAKSNEALNILLQKYKAAMKTSNECISDIAYSANTGRANFAFRAAIIGKKKADICSQIEKETFFKGEANPGGIEKICFLFTGQGSQYPEMGKQLYESSMVFRMHFDHSAKILKNMYNIDICQVIWSSSSNEIDRTIYSQTCIFSVEYALFKLWESLGVKPDFVLGHSMGEFCAAVAAGILSLEDAIMLVAERSRLIDGLPEGKMLVIKADQQSVANAMKRFAGTQVGKYLDYAAINSIDQTVVAGDTDVILEFSKFCTEENMKCTVLNSSHAFHSKHLDPILPEFRNVASQVENKNVQTCGYISGLKGDLVCSDEIHAEYWVDKIREKVNFLKASKKAVELGCNIFVEIGPQPILSALTVMTNEGNKLLCLPSLKKGEDEWATMLTSIGKLYIRGVEIDWNGLDQFHARMKVRLPLYPFIGKKYWPDMTPLTKENLVHPLIGSALPNASPVKLFECALSLETHAYLKDHTIGHQAICPAGGYLEMCLAAGLAASKEWTDTTIQPNRPVKMENMTIAAPLALIHSKSAHIQTIVEFKEGNNSRVQIFQRLENTWLPHVKATFSPMTSVEDAETCFDVHKFHETIAQPCDQEQVQIIYETFSAVGLKYGTQFQSIDKIWKEEGCMELVAKIKTPSEYMRDTQYIIHPITLDAMIQAILALRMSSDVKTRLSLPIKIGKFVWLAPVIVDAKSDLYVYAAKDTSLSKSRQNGSIYSYLVDSTGKILSVMSQVEFVDTTLNALECAVEQQKKPMPDLWEEVWRPASGSLQHSPNLDTYPVTKETMAACQNDNSCLDINNRPELEVTFDKLNKLSYFYMLRAMMEGGWDPILNQTFGENCLFEELGFTKEFRKQFGYFLHVFEEEGIMSKVDKDTWKVIQQPPSISEIDSILTSAKYSSELMERFGPTALLSKLGNNLGIILKGNESAMNFLFPKESKKGMGSSAAEFYTELGKLVQRDYFPKIHMTSWIQNYKMEAQLSGQHGFVFRILEVGAGTGGYTEPFLEILDECGIEYEYAYTDISSAFFPDAKERFKKHLMKMNFRVLNIEEDPISQGFVPSSYDIVVSFAVIHATRSLKESLRNVRALLKINGHFDLCEMIRCHRFITFTFGLLDGFWRFTDFDIRPHHCVISKADWMNVLENSGFCVAGAFNYANDHDVYIKARKVAKKNQNDSYNVNQEKDERQNLWLVFRQNQNDICTFPIEKIPELASNRNVVSVIPGESFESSGSNVISVRPHYEEDFTKLLEMLESRGEHIEGIIYGWSLDEAQTSQELLLRPYFSLAKSLVKVKQDPHPRIYLLTSGAIPVEDNEVTNFHSSSLWGFTKTLASEHSDLYCKCIDIGPQTSDMLPIFYELWKPDREIQVAFRGRVRYVPKLIPHKPALSKLELPSGTDKFQLSLPETKSIADLKLEPMEPTMLLPTQVEIQVKATALNFRDVLSVLKPPELKDADVVGLDFSGVVTRMGSQVLKWSVGDSVFGMNSTKQSMPSHIKLHADDLLSIPKDMTFCEASTLPVALFTSIHCLLTVAKTSSSDTVLLHAASGGVGLYAIQLCKQIGATIICTAGSERKRNYLRSLGIQHVYDSRSTRFESEILHVTNGSGVHVVLNSLTGAGFKEATLNVCAEGARFV